MSVGGIGLRAGENAALMEAVQGELDKLKTMMANMNEKRARLFLQWLEVQNLYLDREVSFKSTKRKYSRREIVYVNFGFNPGSEIGGMHYAVVVDSNDKSNPIVNVVPLGSLDPGRDKSMLHKDEVYIGVIDVLNAKESFAIPNQLCAISKLRVYKPRRQEDRVFKVKTEIMDEIDRKILTMFTNFRYCRILRLRFWAKLLRARGT